MVHTIPTNIAFFLPPNERAALEWLIAERDRLGSVATNVIASVGLDDFDDWAALFAQLALTDLGLLRPLSFVVGLQGSLYRAQVVKGVARFLGYDIPVTVGSDRSERPADEIDHLVHADPALVAPQQHVVQDTIGHLSVRLDRDEVADRSVTLLGLASFTDLAQLLEHANWIVDQKVCRAVLMSGIRQRSEEEDTTADQVILNEHGQVMPNWVATNNLFDRRSTSQLFASMQRNHILSIVTRQASYATSVPVELVDTLTVLGIHNPAAQFAGRLAGTLLQRLWQGILSGRVGRSREWFQNVFYTDGRDPFVGRELTLGQLALQPMIRLVDRLVPYDVLPLLGSIDARIATQFFAPVTVMEKGNARCDVVGLSSVSTGLREVQPVPLADLVSALVKWPILKILDVLNVDR